METQSILNWQNILADTPSKKTWAANITLKKIHSQWLVIKEMTIKATVQNADEDMVVTRNLAGCGWKCKMAEALTKKVLQFLRKLNASLPWALPFTCFEVSSVSFPLWLKPQSRRKWESWTWCFQCPPDGLSYLALIVTLRWQTAQAGGGELTYVGVALGSLCWSLSVLSETILLKPDLWPSGGLRDPESICYCNFLLDRLCTVV